MRDYTFRHRACELPATWISELQRSLVGYLQTDDAAHLEEVVREVEAEAWARRLAVQSEVAPAVVVEPLQSLLATALADQRLVLEQAGYLAVVEAAVGVSAPRGQRHTARTHVEEAQGRTQRLARLTELEAPAVVLAFELLGMAELVHTLCSRAPASAPEPERLATERRWGLDGHPVLGDGEQSAVSPWSAAARLDRWADLIWAPPLGDDDAVAAHGPVRAFVAEHERAWPSTLGFWDIHGSDSLREDRVTDVYRDPALWRVPELALPQWLIPPELALHPRIGHTLQATWQRETEAPLPASAIGCGTRGGPVSFGVGDALVRWSAGRSDPFARRVAEVGLRGGAVFSYVWLDSPEP